MTHHHPRRACRTDGCVRRTRSASGRCDDHRRPIPIALDTQGRVNIGSHISLPVPAALELADRIVDTIEAGR